MAQQQQLNESIEQTRNLMQNMRNTPNMESVIMNLFQNNPQLQALVPMLRGGNTLENIAKQMAQSKGIDIKDVIKKLLR